ncbi:hypothetical protein LEN26_007564 [Aphanomyces euteiches]|nr:hypothetical protein LEN26_007564 [Aphanomyces euteiches]
MELPRPSSFFRLPPLPPEYIEQLKQDALANALDLVRKSKLQGGTLRWIPLGSDNDLMFYYAKDMHTPHTNAYLGVMDIAASLNEVIELFQSDSTAQAKEFAKRLGAPIADAAMLYTFLEPQPDEPRRQIGISWRAYQTHYPLGPKRDACELVCHHDVTLNGQRGWVCSYKSIHIPSDIPGNELPLHHLDRLENHGDGYVFLECDRRPGHLIVHRVLHVDMQACKSDRLMEMLVGRESFLDANARWHLRNLRHLDRLLRENRLAHASFLATPEVVPVAIRSSCFRCQRRFYPWAHKANCYLCGEVVCTQCLQRWQVKTSGMWTTMPMCLQCVHIATIPPPPEEIESVAALTYVSPLNFASVDTERERSVLATSVVSFVDSCAVEVGSVMMWEQPSKKSLNDGKDDMPPIMLR